MLEFTQFAAIWRLLSGFFAAGARPNRRYSGLKSRGTAFILGAVYGWRHFGRAGHVLLFSKKAFLGIPAAMASGNDRHHE